MDRILVKGGNALEGDIPISGAKNSALKLMCASLLTAGEVTIDNLPALADIDGMANLLTHLGVAVEIKDRKAVLQAEVITDSTAPYELVRKMRASGLVLGPLVAREGHAKVSLPGGCAIGTRPIDLHLKALEALGATIELDAGYVTATAPDGLAGGHIAFPFVSVGATETALMAAVLADGVTDIENAAREPEIGDLIDLLSKMGAKIKGRGTDRLQVKGVSSLHGADHATMPDRIEAGTYLMATALAGGRTVLKNAPVEALDIVIERVRDAGARIDVEGDDLLVEAGGRPKGVDIETQPYPGFATDLQAQMMALMSLSSGAAMITETIFENRFMHVPELARLGADITVHGASALVRGVDHLVGAPVMATDLRASGCLVIAGLVARGETEINRVYHLDRGYEAMEQKLSAVGADIRRMSE